MLELILLFAAVCGLLAAAWLVYRRSQPADAELQAAAGSLPGVCSAAAEAPARGETSGPVAGALLAANRAAAQRLWRLGFGAVAGAKSAPEIDALVRNNVIAILRLDTLDHRFFPRRPALMPQLMRALDDPHSAADRLARIIAQDPVLTADVLRGANSARHRVSPTPIESVQRAVAVCGTEALRSIVAAAMLRPVFRASGKNFPRLPRVLWERTQHATRAAELFCLAGLPQDRFESQLVVLLNALGPLMIHGAILDVYARNPGLPHSPAVCVALTEEYAPEIAQRIACDWQASRRLLAARDRAPDEPLSTALETGEFLGTLAFFESQGVISSDERKLNVAAGGADFSWAECLWTASPRSATAAC